MTSIEDGDAGERKTRNAGKTLWAETVCGTLWVEFCFVTAAAVWLISMLEVGPQVILAEPRRPDQKTEL